MKKILLFAMIICALQGCIFIAGAAAGAAAVTIVYDHRKLEKIMLDERTTKIATDKIRANEELSKNSHIEVNSFNQIVLLTGQAMTADLRAEAEAAVRTVPDVKKIYNQILIKGPASSFTQASDTWITAKIKTQMLATKGLKSSTIKVITENGTVYLMGLVNRPQAEMAVSIARQVSGVQRVIKIFQYTQ